MIDLQLLQRHIIGISDFLPDNFLEEMEKYSCEIESSVYPFNFYEFAMSYLLANACMSFDEYLNLRDEYINKNRHLDKFEMSGKKVGKYIEDLLLDGDFGLEKPSNEIDKKYTQQTSYDAYMKTKEGDIIRVEIKASRFTDRSLDTNNLMEKAIYYHQVFDEDSNILDNLQVDFWLNFQQLKPQFADIFIFAGIFRDRIIYWVFSSEEIKEYWTDGQHSGNKGNEGQLHIKPDNIKKYKKFLVDKSKLRETIIKKFKKLKTKNGIIG